MAAKRTASPRLTRFAAVGCCGAFALSLTACAGSSGLKKADLAAKANAICGAQQAKISAVATPANIQDPAQAASFFDATVPLIDKEVADVAALKPADDAKSQFNEMVSSTQSFRRLADTIKRKADARDPSGLQDLRRLQPVQDRANRAAAAFGATACSNTQSANAEGTFKAAFQPIRAEYNSIAAQVASLLQRAGTITDVRLAAGLRIIFARADAVVAQLGALSPPATIESEFGTLKVAAQKLPGDLATLADEVAAHSQTARQSTQRLILDLQAAQGPGKAITSKLGLGPAQ